MALEEEPSGATHEMQRAIDWLRDCADLAGVDPVSLEFLAAGAVHFSLPAGHLLFEAGANPDGVYLLTSGRLGVKTQLKSGLTAEIERGELVGEAGWLLDTPRSATVVALRDSELLLVDGAAINNLPVDVMQGHAPGFVIGCDVGADRNFGERRVNIFEILMHAGMINSTQANARNVNWPIYY